MFHRSLRITFAFVFTLAAACAETGDDTATGPCPAITGDKHLAMATVTPGGYGVMIHTVGKACPTVGENTFALYPSSKMAHAPGLEAAMATGATGDTTAPAPTALLAIESVTITMPSMGHGPAKEPVIDAAQANRFSAQFQMPGDWRAEITFVAAGVTTTAQTAVLDFTVQ
jgi:hypothetical protein